MARVVITAVVLEGRSKSAVARDYGVSRRWVQILVARYLAEGEAAFGPRSRRPHTSPRRTSQVTEDAIVAWRKELAEAGHDAGAETIAWHLRQRAGSAPAVATIWRILSRRGFVTPQPHKRPRSSWRRFEADLPNEVWQAGASPTGRSQAAMTPRSSTSLMTHPGCWPPASHPRPRTARPPRPRSAPRSRPGGRPGSCSAVTAPPWPRPVPSPGRAHPHVWAMDRAQPLPPLPPADLRQGRAVPVRHEARCRIPGSAGGNSEGGSWV